MSGISPISAVSGGSGGWYTTAVRSNRHNMGNIEPVDPVIAVTPVQRESVPSVAPVDYQIPSKLEGSDPVEMSVRGRMDYGEKGENGLLEFAKQFMEALGMSDEVDPEWMTALVEESDFDLSLLLDPAEMAVRSRINYASDSEIAQLFADLGQTRGELSEAKGEESSVEGLDSAEKVHPSDCQTCQSRTYVDGSDDGSVSYQSPTHISPEDSAVKVRAHEQEHVVNEQAYAERDDREVVSQNVQIFQDICPECGTSYTSGGLTTTVTQEKQGDNTHSEPTEPETEVA